MRDFVADLDASLTRAWDAYVNGRAAVLAGSAGWYAVDPEIDGGVSLYGPILSFELAYAVAEELDARRATRVRESIRIVGGVL